MIIELTGAPGSGKSTIVGQILNLSQKKEALKLLSLKEALVMVFNRLTEKVPGPNCLKRPLWYAVMFWNTIIFPIENFSLFLTAVSSQLDRPMPWNIRFWILRLTIKQWGQYRLLRRYLEPNEAVIVDGGLIHFTVALFTSERQPPSIEHLTKYVQHLPKSEMLIFLKVSPDLCVSRVNNRKCNLPPRLQGLSQELIVSFIRNQWEAVNSAAREALRCGWHVVVLDNTASLQETVNQLGVQLSNLGPANT